LAGALDDLALNIAHRFRMPCTLESDASLPVLDHGVAAHLFRIAQEAVNNAVTHAEGDRIAIVLVGSDGKGLLSVRDNGVGLPDREHRGVGSGLHTMACRARLIGGTLEVGGRASGGTAVTCTFPLSDVPGAGKRPNHAQDDR